ncbi:MAG: riboflavin kinase [Candidatus Andersenbacteria bacterium]
MTPPINNNTWMEGLIIHGDGRGRKLGFPTANIQLNEDPPSDGIYACWARLSDGELYQAVLHVGPRPTFPGARNSVELHLLNFPDQDLYGQATSFLCVQKMREVTKFNSSSDLSLAIRHDCEKAQQILENSKFD